jgi:hypothetical protein
MWPNRLALFAVFVAVFFLPSRIPAGDGPEGRMRPEIDVPPARNVTNTGRIRAPRETRTFKWEVSFGELSAKVYLDRLHALDIHVGVVGTNGSVLLLRDLKEPPGKPQLADIRALKRNWFIDNNRASLRSVASELKLEKVPRELHLYYSYEFEHKLLEKLLDFRGQREDDIAYTRFKILLKDKKPAVEVVEQRMREVSKGPAK